jgi:hypothetical protein
MDFSSFFIEHPGEPLRYEGIVVYEALMVPLAARCEVQIEILHAKKAPKQYVTLRSKNCRMKFVEELLDYVHISARSKPNPFVFEISDIDTGAQLLIWNSWKHSDEIEFGIGNSGVIYEEIEHRLPGKTYLVKAASNEVRPTFNSVVFTVTILHG